MKNLQYLLGILAVFSSASELIAQVTPFSMPPRWYFGHKAGMNFTGGSPVELTGNVWDGVGPPAFDNQEGATTQCFPDGSVAFYSNSCQLKDAGHVVRGDNPLYGGGNSSTQGVISVPDPASPTNRYYLITAAVDGSGGSNCSTPEFGIYAYLVDASTNPITVGGRTQLIAGQASSSGPVNEALAASSDYNGGYWIVTAYYNSGVGNIHFAAWHITASGINLTPVYSPAGAIQGGVWNFQPQGSIVFNKCNNRIGYTQHGTSGTGADYWVYEWDATNGTATNLIRKGVTGNSFNYGCEFSPDGNILYTTGLNSDGALKHINLSTGTVQNVATVSPENTSITGWGNLKLGPDDKIYVSPSYSAFQPGPKYLAVINSPNATTAAACGYNATGYQLSTNQYPSTQRGLITLGWHNPTLTINESSATNCMTFSHQYKQYYGADISVLANSQEWDFGEGGGWQTGLGANPTYEYTSNGLKTVKLRLKDQTCNIEWTTEKVIDVGCFLPVNYISFDAYATNAVVNLKWATAQELNNDYFNVMHSTDGVNYTSVGIVKGHGTTNDPHHYQFMHYRPANGNNYYRLIQVDFDGTEHKSKVVSASVDGIQVSVFPNPTTNNFNVKFTGADHALIIVTDMFGREVFRSQFLLTESEFTFGEALPKSTYLLKVVTNNEIKTIKIDKQ
ncbi:MAG TPA: T9SS type A sorting domain-containing protein [Cytophagaceae bacterium]